jgi:predicted small secreted protein
MLFIPQKETVMYLKLAAILITASFVSGCNTVEGVGKDVQRGGEKLESTASKHKSSPAGSTSDANNNSGTTTTPGAGNDPPSNGSPTNNQ